MSKATDLILVSFLGLLAWWWVLDLPFKVDDLTQIPEAPTKLLDESGPVGRLLFPSLSGGPDIVPEQHRFRFRPVLWASFVLDGSLCGQPFSPSGFHATSLVLHLLTSIVVLLLLRRLFPRGAALIGALFFAGHPGASLAVSWIAARGDILVTLFGCLSLWIVLGSGAAPGRRRLLLAGVLAALAALSKITALPMIAVLLITLWIKQKGRAPSGRLTAVSWLLLPPLLALVWRQAYLGSLSLGYAGGIRFTPQALPEMAAQLHHFLAHVLVPWDLDVAAAPHAPWLRSLLGGDNAQARLIAAGMVAVVPLTGLVVAFAGTSRQLLAAAGALLLLALPPLTIFRPLDNNELNRAFYPLMVPIACGLAITTSSLLGQEASTRSRKRILTLACLLAGLALFSADCMTHLRRLEWEGAAIVSRHVGQLRKLVNEMPDDTAFVLSGLETYHAGVPLVGNAMPRMFRKPFSVEERLMEYVPTQEQFATCRMVHESTLAIQPLHWRDGLLTVHPRLPAFPANIPTMLPQGNPATSWRPSPRVPTRYVRSIVLEFPPGDAISVQTQLVTAGLTFEHSFDLPSSSEPRSVPIVTAGGADWALNGELLEVRVQARYRPLRAPVLSRHVPELVISSPAEKARLPMTGPVRIAVKAGGPGSRLRFRFVLVNPDLFRYALSYLPPATAVQAGASGLRSYVVTEEHFESGDWPWLRLSHLPDILDNQLRRSGLREVGCRLVVELLDPSGRTVQARSAVRRLTLVR